MDAPPFAEPPVWAQLEFRSCAPVISTDQRNSCVERFGWCFPTEGFPWASIELSRHDIELPLGDVA